MTKAGLTKGTLKPKTRSALDFLKHYADQNGLQSSDGRGSKRDKPVIRLPIEHQRKAVFNAYVKACTTSARQPLGLRQFYRVWKENMPELKVPRRH